MRLKLVNELPHPINGKDTNRAIAAWHCNSSVGGPNDVHSFYREEQRSSYS
jgi:hypothetical protein